MEGKKGNEKGREGKGRKEKEKRIEVQNRN